MKRCSATTFLVLILTTLLIACHNDLSPSVTPETSTSSGGIYQFELRSDATGRYVPRRVSGLLGDGAEIPHLQLEERFYVDLRQARYVVIQRDLDRVAQALGSNVAHMQLSVYRDDQTLETWERSGGLLASQQSDVLYASELYPLTPGVEPVKSNPCASFTLSYTDPTFYPVNLDLCKRRVPMSR